MLENSIPVDLPALIEDLESLYSDPEVAVRELIQNARSGLIELRHLRLGAGVAASIRLLPNAAEGQAGTVAIYDNGAGMTYDEVQRYLVKIAAGKVRQELLPKLSKEDAQAFGRYAGRFGLGFWATLMVAEKVEVRTRSRSNGEAGVYLCCQRGDSTYAIEERSWDRYGTEVKLWLRPDFARLADHGHLEDLVKRYADLVEYPIFLGEGGYRLNRMYGPWQVPDGQATDDDYVVFLRDTGHLAADEHPLTVIPLLWGGEMGGVLFLPADPPVTGQVALHVSHLYVNATPDYMPDHLQFVSGVVDCTDMPLTLSREAVIRERNPAFEQLRVKLRAALIDRLREIKRERPRTLAKIADSYGHHLKRAALEDDDLLDAVAQAFKVTLSDGHSHMTLGEVVERPDETGKLYYVDNVAAQAVYAALLTGRGTPVVDASNRLDWMLFHKYASLCNRDLTRADAASAPKPTADRTWKAIEDLFAETDERIHPQAVELDADIPALFAHTEMDVRLQILMQARQMGVGNGPEAGLAMLFSEMDQLNRNERRILFLNTGHSLMQSLKQAREAHAVDSQLKPIIKAVVASAHTYSEQLDPAGRKLAYDAQVAAYQLLLQCLVATQTQQSA